MNSQFKEVRTRFAPSPTGYLHVGGARTALFNYLYAKAMGGKYILRVEDTDQERSTKKSEELVLESLGWLNLSWDEGPVNAHSAEVKGKFGPYRQSERLGIYQKYALELIEKGHAYRCFCTGEELEKKKKQREAMGLPPVYDGKCRNLNGEEIQKKLSEKNEFTIRFRSPQHEIVVEDMVQKEVRFDASLIGDFIIIKSDQFPSYNFAVVIDDHLMQISHVIRGVGHLSNTPRQIVIYNAFGWPVPHWAHVSEIVGSDHKKLSKRHGATSITAFRELGYSAEAFVNFIALLGWSHPQGKEYLTLEELSQSFDVARCSKSPAMFDVFDLAKVGEADLNSMAASEMEQFLYQKSKLNHLSNLRIRATSEDQYIDEILPFVERANVLPKEKCDRKNFQLTTTLLALRVYLSYYLQIGEYLGDFFHPFQKEKISADAKEWLAKPHAKKLAETFKAKIAAMDEWQVGSHDKAGADANKERENLLASYIKQCGEELGIKGKDLFMVLRAAVTGKVQGLELPVFIILLGKEKTLSNLQTTMGVM